MRREHSSSVHVPRALDEISLCIHPGGGKPWAYTQDLEPRSRPEFRLGKSRAEKICSVFKRRFPAMRPCGWQGEAGNRGTARRQPVDKPWSTRLRWIGSLPHREAPRWRRTSRTGRDATQHAFRLSAESTEARPRDVPNHVHLHHANSVRRQAKPRRWTQCATSRNSTQTGIRVNT